MSFEQVWLSVFVCLRLRTKFLLLGGEVVFEVGCDQMVAPLAQLREAFFALKRQGLQNGGVALGARLVLKTVSFVDFFVVEFKFPLEVALASATAHEDTHSVVGALSDEFRLLVAQRQGCAKGDFCYRVGRILLS